MAKAAAKAKKPAAGKRKTAAKKVPAKTVLRTVQSERRLRAPKRPNRRLRRQLKAQTPRLPNVWRLTRQSARLLWTYRRLFGGIILIYGLLNLVLVKGLASSTDVGSLKDEFNLVFHGNFGHVLTGLSVFAQLVSSAGNGSSDTAGAYQFFLIILVSLAVIWALRQSLAGARVRVREAYYRGMYPLVPSLLVLLVIGVQLLPLIIGASLYNILVSNGIVVNGFEQLIAALIALALALWSLWMLSSSLFALYIVTLPDMTPLKALRSAKQLVRYRRWTLARKILFLPLVLLIAAAILMLPIILFITPVAQWVFFILTMAAVAAVHAYMYNLYRELLREA